MGSQSDDLYFGCHADHDPDALGYLGCCGVFLCEFDVGCDLLAQHRALVWEHDTGFGPPLCLCRRKRGALRVGWKIAIGVTWPGGVIHTSSLGDALAAAH